MDSRLPFLLGCMLAGSMSAQVGLIPTDRIGPQAKTRAELLAFGSIYEAPSPVEVLEKSRAFRRDYPDSQFLALVWTQEMYAHEHMNDFERTVQAARRVLEIAPISVDALLTLARVLANRSPANQIRFQEVLAEAAESARKGLEELDKLSPPRSVEQDVWRTMRRRFRADGLEVLGLVALKRGAVTEAIDDFEGALRVAPSGSLFYRLGVAYKMANRRGDAVSALEKARCLGPDEVRRLVVQYLVELQ